MFQGDGQHQLQKIFNTCPLLEDLRLFEIDVLTYGYGDTEFVIQAPNLRRLTFCLLEGFDCIFDKLPPLHSAAIDMWDWYNIDHNFAKLLAGLVEARNLQLRLSTQDEPVHSHFILSVANQYQKAE
jgi:hypothetical protein